MAQRRKKKTAHTIFVPHKPVPKGRPRLGRRGRVFTPQTTLDAEAQIAGLWDGPKFETLVKMDVVFTPTGTEVTVSQYDGEPSKLRGDIDNYLKLLMDGLNGVAWIDDKQVSQVNVEKK